MVMSWITLSFLFQSESHDMSEKLMAVDLNMINFSECEDMFSGDSYLTSRMICAGRLGEAKTPARVTAVAHLSPSSLASRSASLSGVADAPILTTLVFLQTWRIGQLTNSLPLS